MAQLSRSQQLARHARCSFGIGNTARPRCCSPRVQLTSVGALLWPRWHCLLERARLWLIVAQLQVELGELLHEVLAQRVSTTHLAHLAVAEGRQLPREARNGFTHHH